MKVRRLNLDALIYCIVWAALAIFAWNQVSHRAGLMASVGLFLIVMPTSAILLSRTGNFRLERAVRWAILAVAAIAILSFADLT